MRGLYVLFSAIGLAMIASCNFDKNIDLNLPPYKRQLLVECYLDSGTPLKALVTYSTSYFDSLGISGPNTASVVIRGNGLNDSLRQGVYLDVQNNKLYNFLSPMPFTWQPRLRYELEIKDDSGRVITGSTTIPALVKIDSITKRFYEQDTSYLLSIWFKDPPLAGDRYRLAVNRDSLTGGATTLFDFSDNIRNGQSVPVRTSNSFKGGDSLIVRLYHIEQQYADFLESASDAQSSNGNPFAQPASLKSTVRGGVGVFTALVYDQKELVLPK